MKLAAQTVAPLPSSSISKMEDRKRPAAHGADDLAPPTKRQATNGSKASADSDLPWKDDLEVSVTRPLSIAAQSHYSTTCYEGGGVYCSIRLAEVFST